MTTDALISKLEEIRNVADDLAAKLVDAAAPPDLAVAKSLVAADKIVTALWRVEAMLGTLKPAAGLVGGKRKKGDGADE
jgi:hypothetical protein